MTEQVQTTDGEVQIAVDFENEEVRVDGVVQNGDFEDNANFIVEQLSEGKLERVEE